nr:SusC/RagA family TonB-linked outer membrane protein [Tenuifilaceae bacterium]
MRRLCVFLTAFFVLVVFQLSAQTVKISGVVTSSDDKLPLQGVSVVVVGSALGAVTNAEGRYDITVSTLARHLRFSFVGYKMQEVPIEGRAIIDVVMEVEPVDVKAVTVTALGIVRAERATGYAIQSLSDEEILKSRETNIINSLQGKVSGAIITNTSGAVGTSTRMVLRGANSLSTDNQPLFVVDNVIVNNSNFGNTYNEGVNRGSGIADINPNDVETITVLKGPNAAALYGSRAANGVVIIKTKTADKDRRFGISFNSNTTVETPLRLPDFQNSYGQGTGGLFEFYDGKGGGLNDYVDESWGPRLDVGLKITQWNSPVVGGVRQATPWVSFPDNVRNFFEYGKTFTNNLSIEGSGDNYSVRVSYTNSTQNGMIPNTDIKRNSVQINASASPYDYLTINFSGNYINSKSDNMPVYGYSSQNVMQQFLWFGRQVDIQDLKKYRNSDGSLSNWNNYSHNNPYFTLNENLNGSDRDRLLGQGSSTIRIAEWLTLKTGLGVDYYTNFNTARSAFGDVESPNGYYGESKRTFRELNTDFLFQFNKKISSKLDFYFNIGGNRMEQYVHTYSASANELAVEDVYTLSNSKTAVLPQTLLYRKRINSLYFNVQFEWKKAFFIDFSGRNDWSTTLPFEDNSYFYPAVNVSAVLSDLFQIQSRRLTYAKLRAGWSQVGADTDPYQLKPVYKFGAGWNSSTRMPSIYIPDDYPNDKIKPQKTESFEVGADFRFFLNRLSVDLTYYNQRTFDQIIRVPVSPATGYTSVLINAGEITNSGIELTVDATPVKQKSGFQWNVAFNFAKNNNVVKSLYDKLDNYEFGAYWDLKVLAIPNQSFGSL